MALSRSRVLAFTAIVLLALDNVASANLHWFARLQI